MDIFQLENYDDNTYVLKYIQNNKELFIDYLKSIKYLEETENLNDFKKMHKVFNIIQARRGILEQPYYVEQQNIHSDHYRIVCFEYYLNDITEDEKIQILNILDFNEQKRWLNPFKLILIGGLLAFVLLL